MPKNDLKYKIAVTLLPGVGPVLAKNLISYCGGVEAVFHTPKAKLEKIPGIGPKTAKAITENRILEEAEKETVFIKKNDIQPLFYLDHNYPQRLKECFDHPVLLYYKGTTDLNSARILSVIGTRKPTEEGKLLCEQIIEGLAPYNVLIVSGLAYGVDITAHKAALKAGLPTIGVLGHGLDRIYPALHKPIVQEMTGCGGLLTEFPSGTNPDRENFPKRNRIVAGLADATLIIETAIKGGSMITAELAGSYSREVFAIPGRPKEKRSEGCNFLIKANKAALVESAEDILYNLRWDEKDLAKAGEQKKLKLNLNGEEKKLADFLAAHKKAHIDQICTSLKIDSTQAASMLLNLEMMGAVQSLPGKTYKLS